LGPNFLLTKLAVLKHLDTVEDKNKNVDIITGQLKLKHICAIFEGDMTYYRPPVRHFWGDMSPLSPVGFTPLSKVISKWGMPLTTAKIYCTISAPLSGAMEDCSMVQVQQLQILYHRRCCCMFASH